MEIFEVLHRGGRAGATPTPMAKSLATQSPTCSLVGEPERDMEPEMHASLTMGQIANPQQEEMAAMQERMLNLENALTRVIHHMETQAIQERAPCRRRTCERGLGIRCPNVCASRAV